MLDFKYTILKLAGNMQHTSDVKLSCQKRADLQNGKYRTNHVESQPD